MFGCSTVYKVSSFPVMPFLSCNGLSNLDTGEFDTRLKSVSLRKVNWNSGGQVKVIVTWKKWAKPVSMFIFKGSLRCCVPLFVHVLCQQFVLLLPLCWNLKTARYRFLSFPAPGFGSVFLLSKFRCIFPFMVCFVHTRCWTLPVFVRFRSAVTVFSMSIHTSGHAWIAGSQFMPASTNQIYSQSIWDEGNAMIISTETHVVVKYISVPGHLNSSSCQVVSFLNWSGCSRMCNPSRNKPTQSGKIHKMMYLIPSKSWKSCGVSHFTQSFK